MVRRRAIQACAWLLLMVGCSSREDAQFERGAVLALGGIQSLDSLVEVIGTDRRSIDAAEGAAIRQVALFRSTIAKLPPSRNTRFLLMRASLDSLAAAAEQFSRASALARRSCIPCGIPESSVQQRTELVSWAGRGLGVCAERYSQAVLRVAAAEHVALGTAIVRSRVPWRDPRGRQPQLREGAGPAWPDSVLLERQRQLRLMLER